MVLYSQRTHSPQTAQTNNKKTIEVGFLQQCIIIIDNYYAIIFGNYKSRATTHVYSTHQNKHLFSRGPGTGGDNKQGNGKTTTRDNDKTEIEKTKNRCKKATLDQCDTRKLRRDQNNRKQVDQDSLCDAGIVCQVRACGWLGGTCETEIITTPRTYIPPPPPKNTYLPPKTGY